MELVCHDKNGPSVWKFNPDDEIYYRFKDGEKIHYRAIRGESLPDPMALWSIRKKHYPQANPEDLRPQDATFALYDHWNMRHNAKSHA